MHCSVGSGRSAGNFSPFSICTVTLAVGAVLGLHEYFPESASVAWRTIKLDEDWAPFSVTTLTPPLSLS